MCIEKLRRVQEKFGDIFSDDFCGHDPGMGQVVDLWWREQNRTAALGNGEMHYEVVTCRLQSPKGYEKEQS